MKAKIEAGAREWFLASGTKKVGPLSEARVLDRIAAGRVPSGTRAWKEGMEDWKPIDEISSLGTRKAPVELAKPAARPLARSGTRVAAPAKPARASATPFAQPHRIERADLWRAFELGFERERVKVALVAMAAVLGVGVVTLGALWIHAILGVLALLASGPVVLVTASLALGALGYQTRRRLEGGETPSAVEALSFARGHVVALVASPILVSLLALVPPILLALKSVLSHVPSIGPALAGLSFGIDLALAALALFLGIAASLAWQLCPAIVAFEETGAIATVRALLDVVRTRGPRVLLWPTRPAAALGALSVGLVALALSLVVVPALANYKAIGIDPTAFLGRSAPQLRDSLPPAAAEDALGEPSPGRPLPAAPRRAPSAPPVLAALASFQPSVGLAGMAFWVAVLLAIVVGIVASTANALTGLLYAACRPGNDDLVTRDAWLALEKQGVSRAQN